MNFIPSGLLAPATTSSARRIAPSGTVTPAQQYRAGAILAWLGHLPKDRASVASTIPSHAIRAFQTNYNAEQRTHNYRFSPRTLTQVDGILGANTLAALENYYASAARAVPPFLIPNLTEADYAQINPVVSVPGVSITALGGSVAGTNTPNAADKTGATAAKNTAIATLDAANPVMQPPPITTSVSDSGPSTPAPVPHSLPDTTIGGGSTPPQTQTSTFPTGPVIAGVAGLAVIVGAVLYRRSKKGTAGKGSATHSNPSRRRRSR